MIIVFVKATKPTKFAFCQKHRQVSNHFAAVVHQGSVLSPLLNGICNERLSEANSFCRRFDPNGETMEELRKNFVEWREVFESRGMRVNLGKIKLVVRRMEEEIFDSKIDPCGVCETRVMSNLMLCV